MPQAAPRHDPAQPTWAAARSEVARIVDGLGRPVDLGAFAASLGSVPIDADTVPVVGTLRPHHPRPA